MSSIIPSARQVQFQEWEFGLFLHLGMYTFWRQEGFDKHNPDSFHPDKLDCDQWIRTAKEAGMRYAVLTTKHHEGFCLWPSSYGTHSVKYSSWRDGNGDVVREFTDACHKYGVKVGLYYSPFDKATPLYEEDPKAYDEYFIGHMKELLTNYGTVDLLWFDGCYSEGHPFDWDRIVGAIKETQPEVLLFNMGKPDFRWVGNEYGVGDLPNWNVVDSLSYSIRKDSDTETLAGEKRWLPAECDCRMRLHSWGWRPDDEHTIKSVDELMGLYYYSVGRSCNLLLNIGPNPQGLLPEKDAARLVEFGGEIKRRFKNPLTTMKHLHQENNRWIFEPKTRVLVDHVIAQEDITKGEHIRRFAIKIQTGDNPNPVTIYEGRNVGHKAICQFPPIAAKSFLFEVLEADGEVSMKSIEFHCACQNR